MNINPEILTQHVSYTSKLVKKSIHSNTQVCFYNIVSVLTQSKCNHLFERVAGLLVTVLINLVEFSSRLVSLNIFFSNETKQFLLHYQTRRCDISRSDWNRSNVDTTMHHGMKLHGWLCLIHHYRDLLW